jgi:hypothetical protein
LIVKGANRVMVAKAAIHGKPQAQTLPWIPAFAGMTH